MKSRTALVTGANQGLGRALVAGLAARLRPADRVLLTGRDPDRVRAAAAALPTTGARVEGRVLDVRDPDAITALAAELGEVDIVFSNATSRMSPDADPAAEVDAVAETNNLATTRVLREFAPRMRPGGRLIIVASALGTLDKLDERVRARFAAAATSLDAVDALVAEWRAAVKAGRARVRHVAQHPVEGRPGRGRARDRRASAATTTSRGGVLVAALCPGLIDTAASRPVVRRHEQRADPGRGRRVARRARRRRGLRPGVLRRARAVRPGAARGRPASRCRTAPRLSA